MDGTNGHAALVTAALDGNDEAFEELVRRFQDWAVGAMHSRCLGDFGLAEDAAQEAFVYAYVNLESLRDPRAFPGWLRRLVHTQCNRLIRRKKLATVELGDVVGAPANRLEPAELLEAQERRTTVIDTIADLPEHERSVVTLFYMNEHSHEEISEFLDVSVSAVKFRLHSARKKLKRSFLNMVKDEINELRPSRKDEFAEKVWKGLRGVYVDETQTSFIDGDAPTLLYRGYDIGDLAQHATFEETICLLLHGGLPNRTQLGEFDAVLKAKRVLPDIVHMLIRDSDGGHPMDVAPTAVSFLGVTGGDLGSGDLTDRSVELTAIAPTIVAAVARARQSNEFIAPDSKLCHAANFLYSCPAIGHSRRTPEYSIRY